MKDKKILQAVLDTFNNNYLAAPWAAGIDSLTTYIQIKLIGTGAAHWDAIITNDKKGIRSIKTYAAHWAARNDSLTKSKQWLCQIEIPAA